MNGDADQADKRTRLSFRDFLMTGRLGPISPFTTMAEVAKLFGVPDQWAISGDAVVPTYWWYGPVEMQFDLTPPHEMEWFQIESPNGIGTKTRRVAEGYVLSTDGLAGRTSISTLLRSGVWNLADATFLFGSFGEFSLSTALHCGSVQVVLEIHDAAESELLGELGSRRYLAETGSCPTEWCSWRMVAVHSGMAGLISAPWRAS